MYLANKQKETNPINLAGSLPIPQHPHPIMEVPTNNR